MDEYVIWDYTKPGISFNIVSGRITVFKATLEAMHYPEYFHFLFSPEDLIFGVEPCLVCFNLRQAYEIHEGRMKEAKKAKEA